MTTLQVFAAICTFAILLHIGQLIIIDNRNMRTTKSKDEIATEIINEISEVTGVSVEDIKGNKRKREMVIARQITCYKIKRDFGNHVTLKWIGDYVGKDYSTVIHSIKTVENGIESNDGLIMNVLNELNRQKQEA